MIPEGDNRTRLVCPDCGYIEYANPKIVVGAVCWWETSILLCKRAIAPSLGLWTIPAGFMELGETTSRATERSPACTGGSWLPTSRRRRRRSSGWRRRCNRNRDRSDGRGCRLRGFAQPTGRARFSIMLSVWRSTAPETSPSEKPASPLSRWERVRAPRAGEGTPPRQWAEVTCATPRTPGRASLEPLEKRAAGRGDVGEFLHDAGLRQRGHGVAATGDREELAFPRQSCRRPGNGDGGGFEGRASRRRRPGRSIPACGKQRRRY